MAVVVLAEVLVEARTQDLVSFLAEACFAQVVWEAGTVAQLVV